MSDYTETYTATTGNTVAAADFETEFDNIATAIATKANKIASPTANNVIEQDANGDLVDTGLATPAGDFVGTSDTQTLTNKTLTDPVINTSSFSASKSANQSISAATWTKIQLDTEDWDTNSDYDNATNYRFTPTVAGKYLFTLAGEISGPWTDTNQSWTLALYENGSAIRTKIMSFTNTTGIFSIMLSAYADANGSTDYYEMYAYQTDSTRGAVNINGGVTKLYFQGQWVGT